MWFEFFTWCVLFLRLVGFLQQNPTARAKKGAKVSLLIFFLQKTMEDKLKKLLFFTDKQISDREKSPPASITTTTNREWRLN